MKQKLYLIYIWVLFLLALPTNHVQGQEGQLNANLDSIDISLLTCGPGNESYSYYGHTAIRIHDKHDQRDVVVNYGMFSFEQKHFVWRFIFGLTDYQMGMVSFADFMKEYEKENRWVQEQLLNLTPKEKEDIVKEIGTDKKISIQRSKGLGENDPEMMWMTTMNPETRRLIKVMPEDAERTAHYFDVLLGDSLQERKNFIAENGARYLELADIS